MNLISGISTAAITLVVLLAGGLWLGFAVLFRRRGDRGIRSGGPNGLDAITQRAGGLLVATDDAVREADDELGYAMAQFGGQRARSYAEAVAAARAKLTEAFRLRQALDDTVPDSERQRREWTLQIIALCEQAQSQLSAQQREFSALRSREVGAAGTLTELRTRIDALQARVSQARDTLATLAASFDPSTLAAVEHAPEQAGELLEQARRTADAAAPAISPAGVSAVSATLDQAAQQLHRAQQLLDSVDRAAHDLDTAAAALTTRRTQARADLAEAKKQREAAPDADSGRAIIEAMAAVETALAVPTGPSNPLGELDRLGEATEQLDLALASARNQTQRLAHARAAYEGTLVSASSQIAAVREYIGQHGGGAQARTRLAEAQRQCALAQAETDPVAALDTIRRAVTLATDADALARFDTMRH